MSKELDRLGQSYFIATQDAKAYNYLGHPVYHFATGLDALRTAKMIISDLAPEWQGPFSWGRRLFGQGTFTRSNGAIVSRLYERLTKRSRRRQNEGLASLYDQGYRQGLYDAYKALQEELA